MSSLLRRDQSQVVFSGCSKGFIAAFLALGLGGCSADIARFDFPSASLSGNSTGAIPTPSEPVRGRSNLGGDNYGANGTSSEGGAYFPAQSKSGRSVEVSTLPDTAAPAQPAYAASPKRVAAYEAPVSPSAPPAAFAAASDPIAQQGALGEQIEVRPGDTLYGLSKRHKVSLNELMTVNNLTSPGLKPGQKLYLPSVKPGAIRQPERTETAAIAPVEVPADWTGSYTVRTGDSLYAIARRNNIKLTDLQKYNGISDVRRVKPGAVLRMPSGAGGAVVAQAPITAGPVGPAPATAPITVTPSADLTGTAAPAQPTILNSGRPGEPVAGQQVAELKSDTATDASSAAPPASGSVAEAGKLRWPVKGKVITPFGPRADGTHNDGINVAVPMGTDVHAAESGTVAYAGSELKGYGNLVLLRHDNGLVTAYAHSEELKVKRGDKVKRGQVIAKAGKTGQVDQPQLHFEVRQGQKPVDPTPFLERL